MLVEGVAIEIVSTLSLSIATLVLGMCDLSNLFPPFQMSTWIVRQIKHYSVIFVKLFPNGKNVEIMRGYILVCHKKKHNCMFGPLYLF